MSRFELVNEDIDDATLAAIAAVQPFESAGVKDELLEQRRNVDDGALWRKSANKFRKKVKSAHGDLSGHGDGMGSVCGNPDSTKGRDHPGALRGAKGHHAVRSENQLVFGMKMLRDEMPVREVAGNAGDLGVGAAAAIAKDAVTLFRHSLSQ